MLLCCNSGMVDFINTLSALHTKSNLTSTPVCTPTDSTQMKEQIKLVRQTDGKGRPNYGKMDLENGMGITSMLQMTLP